MTTKAKPWTHPMPDDQFGRLCKIVDAPAPSGLERAKAALIEEMFQDIMIEGWKVCTFGANAGIVLDTAPGRDDLLTVMVMGHLDQIRFEVSQVDKSGRIWLGASESFMPAAVLNSRATLFVEDTENPGTYGTISGTIEAIGAIHFADVAVRTGEKGIKKDQLYFDCCMHGEDRAEQAKQLGIRPGAPVIFDNPVRRGFAPNTFQGAYLDNGLGCFTAFEVAKLIAEMGGLPNLRLQFAMSTCEELDRLGARSMIRQLSPDLLIAVDVNHDYESAPGIEKDHRPQLARGKGYTLGHGSLVHPGVVSYFKRVSALHEIPFQCDMVGRDTGTDAMASVHGDDTAAITVGFPICNMHTQSEHANTKDVVACIHAVVRVAEKLNNENANRDWLHGSHPNLSLSTPLLHPGA